MKFNHYLINGRQLGQMVISGAVFREIINWKPFVISYLGIVSKKEQVVMLSSGIRLSVNLNTTDKWPIHEIVLRDDYRLKKIAQQCTTIIDLGANIGVFALYLASLNSSARIYAFEPDPSNFSRLVKNIRDNELTTRIFPFQLACANEDGERLLYLSKHSGGHSLTVHRPNGSIRIVTQSLESIFRENDIKQCDLLKIDIEGGEYEVLYSINSELFQRIKYITMEYHNLSKIQQQTGSYLKRYLENKGFFVELKESPQHEVGQIFAVNSAKI